MARLIYAERAFADLERLVDFLAASDPEHALAMIDLVAGAVDVLSDHPLIGRPIAGAELHELVISRGSTGYIAIYSVKEIADTVLILAIRHQREAGFAEGIVY